MQPRDGGYDSGYRAVACFWGTLPSSLVELFISQNRLTADCRVLDLGCGEGKNAAAFAKTGCRVDAVDCSSAALNNGLKLFSNLPINWIEADAANMIFDAEAYDVVVAYGLLHCLRSAEEIAALVEKIKSATIAGGHNIICTFNDRSQDLRAHPGFSPTLLSHGWYQKLYVDWICVNATDSDLNEAHPHNGIWHHHSLTRMLVRRPT